MSTSATPSRRGQVLAEIDAPEVVAEQNKTQAVVEQAITRLASARAAVTVVHASLEADKAKADAVAATVSRLESILRYREKSLERLRGLAARTQSNADLLTRQRKTSGRPGPPSPKPRPR